MDERNRRCSGRLTRRILGSSFIVVSLIGTLAGCESGDGTFGGYPSLRSVPEASRASLPVDDRRDIVRGLIEERDRSRQQTAVVRMRSGLGVDRFPASPDDEVRAEDVIPDTPVGDDDGFRLTPGNGDSADSVYRGESQFEDGSLDDFIRKLKRETRPPAAADEPADATTGQAGETSHGGSGTDDAREEDVDARWFDKSLVPTRLLAAFAPVLGEHAPDRRDVIIRLAAAEEEPGFFCSYLGWTVAWSSMCVDETETSPAANGEEGVGADLGNETEPVEDEAASDSRRSTRARSTTSDETRQERAERRLSEEDAAEAIENAGRGALAPVTSSLDKLRDFIEARRTRSAASSEEERTPALRRADPAQSAAIIDRPPLPRSRPERRLDVSIDDGDERFDFLRTPRPHFRPVRDGPMILPPANESPAENSNGGAATPHRPHLKPTLDLDVAGLLPPNDQFQQPAEIPTSPPPKPLPQSDDPVAGQEPPKLSPDEVRERLDEALAVLKEGVADIDAADEAGETAGSEVPPLESETLAAIEPSASPQAEITEPGPIIIMFEPRTPGLPEGAGQRLATVLEHAKSTDQKIHIIGEASTNHLARRRATDVGAVLVQLGATVEILEYDHQARTGVDQVRLVLKPDAGDPLFPTTGQEPIDK